MQGGRYFLDKDGSIFFVGEDGKSFKVLIDKDGGMEMIATEKDTERGLRMNDFNWAAEYVKARDPQTFSKARPAIRSGTAIAACKTKYDRRVYWQLDNGDVMQSIYKNDKWRWPEKVGSSAARCDLATVDYIHDDKSKIHLFIACRGTIKQKIWTEGDGWANGPAIPGVIAHGTPIAAGCVKRSAKPPLIEVFARVDDSETDTKLWLFQYDTKWERVKELGKLGSHSELAAYHDGKERLVFHHTKNGNRDGGAAHRLTNLEVLKSSGESWSSSSIGLCDPSAGVASTMMDGYLVAIFRNQHDFIDTAYLSGSSWSPWAIIGRPHAAEDSKVAAVVDGKTCIYLQTSDTSPKISEFKFNGRDWDKTSVVRTRS